MTQAVSHWPLTMDAWAQSQGNPCGKSGIGAGRFQVLWFSHQYHSTNALYSCLLFMLHNLSN
jgi:hypothetical protein